MTSMMAAFSETGTPASQCNVGFLRDDAILVITYLTDDWYDINNAALGNTMPDAQKKGPTYPQAWYDSIVEAKNGNIDAVVMIGLFYDDVLWSAPLLR